MLTEHSLKILFSVLGFPVFYSPMLKHIKLSENPRVTDKRVLCKGSSSLTALSPCQQPHVTSISRTESGGGGGGGGGGGEGLRGRGEDDEGSEGGGRGRDEEEEEKEDKGGERWRRRRRRRMKGRGGG